MIPTAPKPAWQRAIIALSGTVIACLIFSILYWARTIFIPLTLAIFFTFVLSPVVMMLQRRRLGRTISVILVMLGTLTIFGITTYFVTQQMTSLAKVLPDYGENIKAKVAELRNMIAGEGDSRLGKLIDELEEVVSPKGKATEAKEDGPQTVVIEPQKPSWTSQIDVFVNPAMEFMGQAAFALILVIFMLLKKEDLRNRILRLVGDGQVTTATKAVDDASRRVSKYLLTQLLINTAFGIIISIGLFCIGVKYALLWGFMATLMRYVPYIGTWIGLIPPTLFTLAMSDDWWHPLSVVALFLVLETFCNNVLEPRFYGASLGVSEVAQLVSAAFWSFLWGPIGLILSGPITTCILVLGKHVPALHFLEVLLGDEPPLAPGVSLFQRLAARDQDEATRILIEETSKEQPYQVYDKVLIPALTLMKTASEQGELDSQEEQRMLRITKEVLEDTQDRILTLSTINTTEPIRPKVLFCPARDEADEIALEILAKMVEEKWEVQVTGYETLSSELISTVETFDPVAVCIGSLPPGGLAHTRYLCKRLRMRFPNLRIIVGRWGETENHQSITEEFREAGADQVDMSLESAHQNLQTWLPVFLNRTGGTPRPMEAVKLPASDHPIIGTAHA